MLIAYCKLFVFFGWNQKNINKSFRKFHFDRSFFSVNVKNPVFDHRNHHFFSIQIGNEIHLCRLIVDGSDYSTVVIILVKNFKSDDFVVIELLTCKFWKRGQRKVNIFS